MALSLFWASSILPCKAQTFSTGTAPDPEVLVSQARALNNNPGHNMEETLVDIRAVDAPALYTENNKTGIGSEMRYGQGIIIDSSGIIVTNYHIIGHAQHIDVALSGGKIYTASVLRVSQPDLCLIKINASFPLRAVTLANSSEIRIGNNVMAITNAGFNLQRLRGGQIIKLYKEKTSDKVELMETNITLKAGDSGGPILNQEGSLLGVIMGKQISDPSKSFAIPASLIQREYFRYRNSILS
jgi:S1-C subfamily serine protease